MAYADESPGELGNTVDRNYGLQDLYVDPHHPDYDHIEKKLSQLEGVAANVIRSLVEALDSVSGSVRLRRGDLNTLRKFLFIMAYRGGRRGAQFFHDRFDAGTKADIDAHIRQHLHPGATARDVWLQNIKEILDTDYWAIPENPRIFVLDRSDFENDMRNKRIVFWRARLGEEFITCEGWGFMDGVVVENAEVSAEILYIMRENGSTASVDAFSDKPGTFQWLRVFPLHPGLAVALVSEFMNPIVENGLPPSLQGMRSRFHDLPTPPALDTHYADLSPSAQAASRSSNPIDFVVEVRQKFSFVPTFEVDGKILESRVDDLFTFPLSTLSTEHTRRLNALFLENAAQAITFCSPGQLYRSILALERSTLWDHKRDHGALKAALRAFFYSTHTGTFEPATSAPSTDRRLVWVYTPARGAEGAPMTDAVVLSYRIALDALRSLDLPKELRQSSEEARKMRKAFYRLNTCHNDALLRNEESAMARQSVAESSLSAEPNARPERGPAPA